MLLPSLLLALPQLLPLLLALGGQLSCLLLLFALLLLALLALLLALLLQLLLGALHCPLACHATAGHLVVCSTEVDWLNGLPQLQEEGANSSWCWQLHCCGDAAGDCQDELDCVLALLLLP